MRTITRLPSPAICPTNSDPTDLNTDRWIDTVIQQPNEGAGTYHRRLSLFDEDRRLIATLTAREHDILTLVCEGASNRQIASALGLRLSTVKYHLNHLFGKLGVARRTQLVAMAVQLQLVRPAWL